MTGVLQPSSPLVQQLTFLILDKCCPNSGVHFKILLPAYSILFGLLLRLPSFLCFPHFILMLDIQVDQFFIQQSRDGHESSCQLLL